ncbi:hypothetical protein GGI20_001370 [Coemansia sp. BCRC 34301]|nr:hypothetical protein GGI20_001370 [Coemansia sp. BCRC 34301]
MALAFAVSHAVGPSKCYALTVDHGFRPESSREAKDVGQLMHRLGITHEIRRLRWEEIGSGSGSSIDNSERLPPVQRLEEIARGRRYAEIADVCHTHGIRAVLTGHHAGDQAETFLLRFMRHSGIYGMSGMALQTPLVTTPRESPSSVLDPAGPIVVVRPLLELKKETLYDVCRAQDIRWHEDASNKDARFRRNQLRQLMNAKSRDPKSPFNADSLLHMCNIMQGHREHVNQAVRRHLADSAKFDASAGTVELEAAGSDKHGPPIWATNVAVRERILADVVSWVNCKGHPPELAHLQKFGSAIDGYYREPRMSAAVTVAGVTAVPPSSRHGWLFCRQALRPGEAEPCLAIAFGSAVVWDKRLCVSALWPGICLPPGSTATWCLYSLDDAMRLWHGQITEHRDKLRRLRARLAPYAVQATQPVVCTQIVDKEGGAQTFPAMALGHMLGGLPEAAQGIDISIRHVLGKPGSEAASEVVR